MRGKMRRIGGEWSVSRTTVSPGVQHGGVGESGENRFSFLLEAHALCGGRYAVTTPGHPGMTWEQFWGEGYRE
jgi:hypothetical protein